MDWVVLASNTQQLPPGTSNLVLWGVPTVVGIIFYALGVVSVVYIKRPKLSVIGGGGGGPASPSSFHEAHITVSNTAGRVGVKIGQNTFFGFRVNRPHWFGFPVMREPATGCMGSLYDDKGNHISALWWRDPINTAKRTISLDLESGKQADLFLFAQRNDDAPNYYPYEQGTGGDPNIPTVKFTGTRRFIVRLTYFDGQKKRDFKYTVLTNYRDGKMAVLVRQPVRPEIMEVIV